MTGLSLLLVAAISGGTGTGAGPVDDQADIAAIW